MRHFAITGIVTASWISWTFCGSDMRATPPWTRMSAGTRSSAITATAPASSAIFACSASTTSMITPPFSISARPLLTRIVPYSVTASVYRRHLRPEAPGHRVELVPFRRRRPDEDGVPVGLHDVRQVRPHGPGCVRSECVLGGADGVGVRGERDGHGITGRRGALDAAVLRERGDEADLARVAGDAGE